MLPGWIPVQHPQPVGELGVTEFMVPTWLAHAGGPSGSPGGVRIRWTLWVREGSSPSLGKGGRAVHKARPRFRGSRR
jgi:hypothetical protein